MNKVQIEVEVSQDWIDFLTKYNDMFRTDHSGYWMFGVAFANGWLAFEHDDKYPSGVEADRILASHERGEPLPKGWFVIDEAFAKRAWVEGVKRGGVHWYEDGDASTYDAAVQLAALGEVRYG